MPAAKMRIYTVLSQPANTNGQSYFEKYNYTRTVCAGFIMRGHTFVAKNGNRCSRERET